jgi:hypothetical protein
LNAELQLFVGEASQAEARVYAALHRGSLPGNAELAGELVGPNCRYSQTLAARIRFVDRGPGPALLAEAVVPDPCFWTPELPFMYDAELRISPSDAAKAISTPAVMQRPLGIRRLGVQRRSIYLDAKRFVLRGVRLDAPGVEALKNAREAASALYVENPNDVFLREASEEGVVLAVSIADPVVPETITAEVGRVSRWPAVAVVVLDQHIPAGKELRRVARNTLLAQRFVAAEISTATRTPWAHLVWWELETGNKPCAQFPDDVPVVVFCPTPSTAILAERRTGCDRLQAELAEVGDFAGYFV